MKIIRKLKKYILLILALNILFMSVESEKREAEAFAFETAALILGGVAIVGAGAAILSRGNAETLGQNIINNIESAGQKVEDFFSYNMVTEIGKVAMTGALRSYINTSIGSMKTGAVATHDTYSMAPLTVGTMGYSYNTSVLVKAGDTIRYTITYDVQGDSQFKMALQTGSRGESATSLYYQYAFQKGAHTITETAEVVNTYTGTLSLVLSIPYKSPGSYMDITSLKIDNVTTQGTDVYKNQQQYSTISSDANVRSQILQNNLSKSEYVVSPNNIVENVSTIEQIEQPMPTVEDTAAGTNTMIQRMINAVANIPSAIRGSMDDLWADAGAIWSGMGDTLTNIQTDVNAKVGALSDAMAGGIDNIRTDIGAMMDNLRMGIDSAASAAAANMAAWGQLTLDGIDAGIGAITSGLTNAWTKTTTAIDTASTATTTAINEGIGTITDGLTTITDWVIGFPEMFFSWFVPPDFSFLGPLITKATNDLENKFGTLPSLEDLASSITIQEKSIYDIEISLMGKNYKIVPIALKPTIDWARPFLTAAVNLTSITFLIHRNKRELFK